LQSLIELCEGDLRKAITYLQSVHRLYGGSSGLTVDALLDVAGVVPEMLITSLLQACHEGNFERLQTLVSEVVAEGYAASTLLRQLFDYVVSVSDKEARQQINTNLNTSTSFSLSSSSSSSLPPLNDTQRSLIVQCIAQSDKALLDGADEFLQLLFVTTQISRILHTTKTSHSSSPHTM
jgi:replication factor C subunit 2/4